MYFSDYFIYFFPLHFYPLTPLSLVASWLIPSWQGAAVKQEEEQEGKEGATAANGRFWGSSLQSYGGATCRYPHLYPSTYNGLRVRVCLYACLSVNATIYIYVVSVCVLLYLYLYVAPDISVPGVSLSSACLSNYASLFLLFLISVYISVCLSISLPVFPVITVLGVCHSICH